MVSYCCCDDMRSGNMTSYAFYVSEDFVTPSSTPPLSSQSLATEQAQAPPTSTVTMTSENEKNEIRFADVVSAAMPEELIREKIYDKYTLALRELQVRGDG